MKKWQKWAVLTAVTAAITGSAMAMDDHGMYMHHYQQERVMQQMEITQKGNQQVVRGVKVIDRTQQGVGEAVLSELWNTAVKNKNADNVDMQTVLQQVLDRSAQGKYALVERPRADKHRDVSVYLICDADKIDQQERGFVTEQKNHSYAYQTKHHYGYDKTKVKKLEKKEKSDWKEEWKSRSKAVWNEIERAISRAGAAISGEIDNTDRLDVPREYWPMKEDIRGYVPADIDTYRVVDTTKSLTAEEVRSLENMMAPYVGKKVSMHQLTTALEAADDYLETAFGDDDIFEVYFDHLQPENGKMTVIVAADKEYREAMNGTYFDKTRIGLVDESMSLSRADYKAIDDIIDHGDDQRRFGESYLLNNVKADVEAYLAKAYSKDAFQVKMVHRAGKVYQVVVSHK